MLIGGSATGLPFTATVSIYDPASDSWAAGPELPRAAEYVAMSHEGEVRLLPILDEPENFAFVVGLPIMRNDEPVAELALRDGAWQEIAGGLWGTIPHGGC